MKEDNIQSVTTDAKGPAVSGSSHSFCPTCKRATFSLYKYGPVTPAVYNSSFCTCNGVWKGWDQDEIDRNNAEAAELAARQDDILKELEAK